MCSELWNLCSWSWLDPGISGIHECPEACRVCRCTSLPDRFPDTASRARPAGRIFSSASGGAFSISSVPPRWFPPPSGAEQNPPFAHNGSHRAAHWRVKLTCQKYKLRKAPDSFSLPRFLIPAAYVPLYLTIFFPFCSFLTTYLVFFLLCVVLSFFLLASRSRICFLKDDKKESAGTVFG